VFGHRQVIYEEPVFPTLTGPKIASFGGSYLSDYPSFQKNQNSILYIKANMVSVCVDKNWAVPGRFFESLPVPCGAGDKQGKGRAWQGGQGSRCGGAARGAISIKEILGANRGTCI
jgi:hypothetical protein